MERPVVRLTDPTASHDDSDEEESGNEERPEEETAESWLRRHLLSNISCEDSAIETLLTDVAPLIHMITSSDPCRALFVTVKRNKVFKEATFVEKPVVHFDLETEKVRKRAPAKKMDHRKKSMKKEAKVHRSRSSSKSKSPDAKQTSRKSSRKAFIAAKKSEEELEKENALAAQFAQEQLQREVQLSLPQLPETVLSWHTDRSLPKFDQYFFIVNKSGAREGEASLDELFLTGFVNNNRLLAAALSSAKLLLENKLTVEMNIDILISFFGSGEVKSPKENVLERFIIDCIIRHYCVDYRLRADNTESRSVRSVLQPVMEKFCSTPEETDRRCLLIQLSFFDIDFLDQTTRIEKCANRLTRAVNTLRILNFLYSEETLDWSKKVFILLVDIFSTSLAKYFARKCHLLVDFDRKQIEPICSSFGLTVTALKDLSIVFCDTAEDQASVDKLVNSFDVAAVLEGEIDEILTKVAELHCEKRDTALNRAGIHKAHSLLRELNEYLEENCINAALESSNLDSLRTLTLNLSVFEKKLSQLVSTLPD